MRTPSTWSTFSRTHRCAPAVRIESALAHSFLGSLLVCVDSGCTSAKMMKVQVVTPEILAKAKIGQDVPEMEQVSGGLESRASIRFDHYIAVYWKSGKRMHEK